MRLTVPSIIVATGLAAPLAAQHPATPGSSSQRGGDSAAFVIRLGADTVAIERFTHGATRLEGDAVTRQPRTTLRHYVVDFAPDGRVLRAEVVLSRAGAPPDAPPIQRSVATFTSDSVVVEVRRDTAVQTRRLAVGADVIPVVGPASTGFVSYQLAAAAFRRSRRDSARIRVYAIGAASGGAWSLTAMGADSIRIFDGNNTFHARVDRGGRVSDATPRGGTQQFTVQRVASLDVGALATAFAARDQQGQPLGQLSPRDTVRATIAGATILVDYGRPSKRGRVIFGGTIVPWGEVWRTGANAATQFRADRALEMGGVVVPAGFYTLWTIPSPTGWKLLINAQTGQWGTAHDPARDLYQLDMAVRSLPRPVEQFTVSIEPQGQGGVLHLEWDTTRASLPFGVR